MLLSRLFMVHDSLSSGEYGISELSGRENLWDNLLEVGKFDIKSRRDDAALVQSTVEFDNDLSSSLIINDLKIINVT
jgi:hypothetical protein